MFLSRFHKVRRGCEKNLGRGDMFLTVMLCG